MPQISVGYEKLLHARMLQMISFVLYQQVQCDLIIAPLIRSRSGVQLLINEKKKQINNNKYVLMAVGFFPGHHLAKRFYRSTHKLKQYS